MQGKSQNLNFQDNVNITHNSKETSTPDPQAKKKSSQKVRFEYCSSLSKIVRHTAWIVSLKCNWVASFKYLSVVKLQESELIILIKP